MKKRFAILLTAALTTATVFTVMAAEDISGEWYANIYGIPTTLTLEDSGEYSMVMEIEGEEPSTGNWELDGENLIMDKDTDIEVSMIYDGETLLAEADGMEMVFYRDPEAAAGFVPAEICTDAALEDFAGKWNAAQVSAFGMTASLEMMEMEKIELEIEENLISFTMLGGEFFGEWELPALEGEFADGVLTFVIPAESEYSEDEEYRIYVHEDGTLSMATSMMDEEIVFYMEAVTEETEEVTE